MMVFRQTNGEVTELKQETIDNFKMQLKGQLLFPGDLGFDNSRSLWNSMIEKKPSLILRCQDTTDVITSIRFARENNLLVCIKGGGHNIAGLASAEGGLMLDMSLMRGVWVDREKKIAHTQAGCLLGDVDRETQLYGLAAVLGFVSLTGTAGLTLGGGFGYLTRRWGWTADNVTAMNLVTADGKLVHASETENEDLFWGFAAAAAILEWLLRFNYKLYPVGPEIYGGLLLWAADEADSILEIYRELSSSAPEKLTLVSIMRSAPPAPWIPKSGMENR
jgi:FAD/FMN-containing dehydrogenase